MTSRKYYDMELQKLNGALLEMGEMIRMAISGAVAALLEHDHDRARSIIAYDEEIDKQNRQIEQQCYSLLLSQQPVAGDLRMVSAALKMRNLGSWPCAGSLFFCQRKIKGYRNPIRRSVPYFFSCCRPG